MPRQLRKYAMLANVLIFILVLSIIVTILGIILRKCKDPKETNFFSNLVIFTGIVLLLFTTCCLVKRSYMYLFYIKIPILNKMGFKKYKNA